MSSKQSGENILAIIGIVISIMAFIAAGLTVLYLKNNIFYKNKVTSNAIEETKITQKNTLNKLKPDIINAIALQLRYNESKRITTHLISEISNIIKKNNPHSVSYYVFTKETISSYLTLYVGENLSSEMINDILSYLKGKKDSILNQMISIQKTAPKFY